MRSIPIVNNLKTHISLKGENVYQLTQSLERKERKVHNNFSVVNNVYTFIIFPKSGFVNITGIKSFSDLKNVIPHFCKVFDIKLTEPAELIIDNISAAGSFNRKVNLVRLQEVINSEKTDFSVHYDRNFFSGAFCKAIGFGTVTVFPSGKYVVVGPKCQEHVDSIIQKMDAIIHAL
jgi:TATA-box binding protein (TBP) (component of TFIID and TFIIIB)